MKKKIVIGVLAILIAIQFIPMSKNQANNLSPNAIENKYNTPENVQSILKKACYDCHSNNTTYQWYASIQPVGFWINKHVKNGKKKLNFSEFLTYPNKKAIHKIKVIKEVIDEDEMPLTSYKLIHKDAKLTSIEKKLLIDWLESIFTQQ
jgi:uncharacterized membrane protein